jgi:hypothetical protein
MTNLPQKSSGVSVPSGLCLRQYAPILGEGLAKFSRPHSTQPLLQGRDPESARPASDGHHKNPAQSRTPILELAEKPLRRDIRTDRAAIGVRHRRVAAAEICRTDDHCRLGPATSKKMEVIAGKATSAATGRLVACKRGSRKLAVTGDPDWSRFAGSIGSCSNRRRPSPHCQAEFRLAEIGDEDDSVGRFSRKRAMALRSRSVEARNSTP